MAIQSLIRSALVLLHRYVGLAIAVFALIIGLTGSLLAYLHPISAWLSPELYDAPARSGAGLSFHHAARRRRARILSPESMNPLQDAPVRRLES